MVFFTKGKEASFGGKLGSTTLVGISEGNSGLIGFSSLYILIKSLDIG